MFDVCRRVSSPKSGGRSVEVMWEQQRGAGLSGVILWSPTDHESNGGPAVADKPGVWAATGLHPSQTTRWSPDELRRRIDDLERTLARGRHCAVGPMGLDYANTTSREARRRQKEGLVAQLGLAREVNLPVMVVALGAHNSLIGVLRREGLPEAGGVICDFRGSPRQVWPLTMLDVDISLSPQGVDREKFRELAEQIPDDRLVVQSMAAAVDGGLDGSSSTCVEGLASVLDRLADGDDEMQVLARKTERTARRRFRLP